MLNIELEIMPLGIGADTLLFMAELDGDNADDDTSEFVTCSLSIAFKDFAGIKRQTCQWVTGERVFWWSFFGCAPTWQRRSCTRILSHKKLFLRNVLSAKVSTLMEVASIVAICRRQTPWTIPNYFLITRSFNLLGYNLPSIFNMKIFSLYSAIAVTHLA